MTEEEELLADQLYAAIQRQQHHSPRSEQAREFIMGVSDIGTCKEKTRRILAGIPEEGEQDYLAAFLGTAIGREFEEAVELSYPDAVTQATVSTTVQGAKYEYRVVGHPDILLPWGVLDGKTRDGLQLAEKVGPSKQQLFQRHLYAKAAYEAGYFSVPLGEVKTGNVWIDRSGAEKRLVVHLDVFSEEIVAEAGLWLDDVYYAWEHDEPAEKEPPRSWCERACGHFSDCRGIDSDVTGLIDDPWMLAAVQQHQEALAMERKAKQMKEEAKETLRGVTGNTGELQVRWIHVNNAQYTTTRAAHSRLSITRLNKK